MILGERLATTQVPWGGLIGRLLPLFGIIGILAAAFDFGHPELEKIIVAIGMFSGGVVLSRDLPIWREAKPGEIERIQMVRKLNPVEPWIRMARNMGLLKAVILFVSLCVVSLLLFSSSTFAANAHTDVRSAIEELNAIEIGVECHAPFQVQYSTYRLGVREITTLDPNGKETHEKEKETCAQDWITNDDFCIQAQCVMNIKQPG